MNQGKSDIIAKRKVQALFRNKTKKKKKKKKRKYDNHMQIILININDVTIWRKGSGLIRVKGTTKVTSQSSDHAKDTDKDLFDMT